MTKILIVEDENTLVNIIQAKLAKSGFAVAAARSVNEALDILKKNNDIGVIWLDHYLLGEKDGLDFVVQIKKDDKYKKIPILVISNTASPDKVTAYLELGVERYYVKAEHSLGSIVSDIKKILTGRKSSR